MTTSRKVRFPTLQVAAFEAAVGRTGVVYREGSTVGIVWWEDSFRDEPVRHTMVLATLD